MESCRRRKNTENLMQCRLRRISTYFPQKIVTMELQSTIYIQTGIPVYQNGFISTRLRIRQQKIEVKSA